MNRMIQLAIIRLIDCFRFIYNIAPVWITKGSIYYKTYNETIDFLKETEYWDSDKLRDYQNEQLRKLVVHAYNTVPYYRELFDKNGIDPITIQTQEDLTKLPVLTKNIIKKEGKRLVSTKIPKSRVEEHTTGGSTGKPTTFYFDKNENAKEDAFVDHIYSRIGYSKKDKTLIFSDSHFMRQENEVNPNTIMKRMPGTKRWICNYANINEKSFSRFCISLRKIDPNWIIINPSNLYVICKLIKDEADNPFLCSGLKGVIFKSETLYPHQLDFFKTILRVQFLHLYGHTEHGCIAGTCEKEFCFHIQPQYGISEFVKDRNGKNILVTTGFTNYAMPLLRYYTEDIFEMSNEECSCGRKYKIVKSIEGRAVDYLYMNDGTAVSDIFCDFTTVGRLGKWLEECVRFRILQDEVGKCIIEYIPMDNATDIEAFNVLVKSSCEEYFLGKMQVEAKAVQEILPTARGKEKLIISTLNADTVLMK